MEHFVSCLCASRPNRLGQLQRAVLDFQAQTYANRELVIVVDGQSGFGDVVRAFVGNDKRVRVLDRLVRSQLDCLQFAAMSAFGDILTIWDDDNLNHPMRLSRQVEKQKAYYRDAITVLYKGLYLFHDSDELFVVDCYSPDGNVSSNTLPTTLMAYRDVFPKLDATVRGSPGRMMLEQSKGLVRPIDGDYLHLVGVLNGNHLRTYQFHRQLIEKKARPVAWLRENRVCLIEALDSYWWSKEVVSIEGVDGGFESYTGKLQWPDNLHPVTAETK